MLDRPGRKHSSGLLILLLACSCIFLAGAENISAATIAGTISGYGSEVIRVNVFGVASGSGIPSCDATDILGYQDTDDGTISIEVDDGYDYYVVFEPSNSASSYLLREYWTSDGGGTSNCSLAETYDPAGDAITFAMETGGRISGNISNNAGQATVCLNAKQLWSGGTTGCDTDWVQGIETAPDGSYSMVLPIGDYYLETDASCGDLYPNTTLMNEYWNESGGDRDCSLADTVTAIAGTNDIGNDLSLDQGARISGTINGSIGQEVCVNVLSQWVGGLNGCDTDWSAGKMTDPDDGTYSIVVPAGGPYFIQTDAACTGENPNNLLDEYWTDDNEGDLACDQADQFDLNVGDDVTRNITLAAGAVISGNISGTGGQQVCINARKIWDGGVDGCDTDYVSGVMTDTNGDYTLILPEGDYYLQTDSYCTGENSNNLLDEFWTEDHQGSTSCSEADSLPATIDTPQTANISLGLGAVITGQISGTNGQEICVNVHIPWDGGIDGCETDWTAGTTTDGTGNYSIVVPAGDYYLQADASCSGDNPNNLLNEYWTDNGQGDFSCSQADLFSLDLGDTVTRNIALAEGSVISGTISGTNGQEVCINAKRIWDGGVDGCETDHVGGSWTDSNGDYTIVVPEGDYYIQTDAACTGENPNDLYDKYYWENNAFGTPDCSEADALTTTIGTPSTANILLEQGAVITGNIGGTSGQEVCISAGVLTDGAIDGCDDLNWVGGGATDGSGDYSFVVAPGTYYLLTNAGCSGSNPNYLLDEFWEESGEGTPNCTMADDFQANQGSNPAKNLVLDQGAVVHGQINNNNGEEICVNISVLSDGAPDNCFQEWIGGSMTQPDGTFTIAVPPGDHYFFSTDTSCGGSNPDTFLFNQYWNTSGGSADCEQSEPFELNGGDTNDPLTLTVAQGGRISGILQEDNRDPISGEDFLMVDAYAAPACDYNYEGGAAVDLEGDDSYSLLLPPGQYYIKVNQATVHPNSWWTEAGAGITDDCDSAQLVTVDPGVTNSNKNFLLPKDSDGDDLSDAEEITYGLDINDKDSDDDGIEDSVEVILWTQGVSMGIVSEAWDDDHDNDGTLNIHETDADNDGVSDVEELARGTDIVDENDIPEAALLYDDFSSPSIDPAKWLETDQIVREVHDGILELSVSTRSYLENAVALATGNDTNNIMTSVIIPAGYSLEAGSEAAAGIGGSFYNTEAVPVDNIGEVWTECYLSDQGSGLEAHYAIHRCTAADCAASEDLAAGQLGGTLSPDTWYTLGTIYDGSANNFTFTLSSGTSSTLLVPIATATENSPAYGSLDTPEKVLLVKSEAGTFSAHFDDFVNVDTADGDAFSTSPLDPAKWATRERVRQIDTTDGLRLLSHSEGDRQRTRLNFAEHYNYYKTTVNVSPDSWQNDQASGRSQLQGFVFNESRGPGSEMPYNGYEDNNFASIFIKAVRGTNTYYAGCYLEKSVTADYSDYQEYHDENFDMDIVPGHNYELSMGFGGSLIVFQIVDTDTGEKEASLFPIPADRYLPNQPLFHLASEVTDGGAGVNTVYFDDVYVDGAEMELDGDVDVDGDVDLADAINSLKVTAGQAGAEAWNAGDVNRDGQVGLPETIYILNDVSAE